MAWWQRQTDDSISVLVGAASDVGRVREQNEDAYGTFGMGTDDQLFVIADGMGGHGRGRDASSTAVDVLKSTYYEQDHAAVLERLRHAFQEANHKVLEIGRSDSEARSPGTTGTALVLSQGQVYLGHVGDSRAYHFEGGTTHQLTHDHTVAQAMHRQGLITAEEARSHPRRGTLTRAIGTDETVEIDLMEVGAPATDDRFLLCTDGLSTLSDERLEEIVLGQPPQAACKQLIEHANQQGGHDNVTALIVQIQ